MQGQCVNEGDCPSITDGTCRVLKCDGWRNATCSATSISDHEPKCICGAGTCPIKGECRPPGVCAKATGGTCNVLPCKPWRKATCSVTGRLVVPGEKAVC